MNIPSDDPLAVAVIEAIQSGNIEVLKRLLSEKRGLANARIVDRQGMARTLLHVATDWPGHFPNGVASVRALIDAGADVNAPFIGSHTETPLHWAASTDDVEVLDALLDAGANIEATGAVIGGGTPLNDAVAFGQWRAARRLIERGAQTLLWHAAAVGFLERVDEHFAGDTPVEPDEIHRAFWFACRGGQLETAAYLLARGANLNWIPSWERCTPLDAAKREGAVELVEWLRSQGAKSADELQE